MAGHRDTSIALDAKDTIAANLSVLTTAARFTDAGIDYIAVPQGFEFEPMGSSNGQQ